MTAPKLSPAELEALAPEVFEIARQLRAQAGGDPRAVRILCIHDAEGNLLAGRLPEGMDPPGPLPPPPQAEPERPQRYRGRR